MNFSCKISADVIHSSAVYEMRREGEPPNAVPNRMTKPDREGARVPG